MLYDAIPGEMSTDNLLTTDNKPVLTTSQHWYNPNPVTGHSTNTTQATWWTNELGYLQEYGWGITFKDSWITQSPPQQWWEFTDSWNPGPHFTTLRQFYSLKSVPDRQLRWSEHLQVVELLWPSLLASFTVCIEKGSPGQFQRLPEMF